MTGAIINTAAIVAGGLCGHLFGKLLKDRHQETLTMACGVGTLFLSIAGTMNYMLHNDLLPGGGSMLIIACLALGGLIGEILNIESWFERFGEWLKKKTGNAKDKQFVNGIKRYEPQRHSGFDKKAEIIPSFRRLFELSDSIPNWIVSYNNRSYPDIDTMVELIKPFRKVKVEHKTYKQSRGGKGSVAGSSEILLICTK